MLTTIWKLLTEQRGIVSAIFYVLLAIVSFGLNFIYTNLHSVQTDNKLTEIRAETVHSRIDAFGGTLASFRDEAYRLESETKDLQEQNALLIECIERNDCKKYPQLLKKKEVTKVNIAEAYKPIRSLLGETYTKGDK